MKSQFSYPPDSLPRLESDDKFLENRMLARSRPAGNAPTQTGRGRSGDARAGARAHALPSEHLGMFVSTATS